jgi:hypothetical protein
VDGAGLDGVVAPPRVATGVPTGARPAGVGVLGRARLLARRTGALATPAVAAAARRAGRAADRPSSTRSAGASVAAGPSARACARGQPWKATTPVKAITATMAAATSDEPAPTDGMKPRLSIEDLCSR